MTHMLTSEIRTTLLSHQDKAYKDFQSKLLPTVSPERIIGVRTPELRKMARQLVKRDDVEEFLRELPHRYFDENQLHGFVIAEIRGFDTCLEEVRRFLPFIDNWATCDQLSPKVFGREKGRLLEAVKEWLNHRETYTIRFAIGMLMQHFLDEDFVPAYADMVAAVRSEDYYVNMMRAWYFATALAKQYDRIIPYLRERRLDPWTHNMTIRKAVESRRIAQETKSYLRTLRVNGRPAGSLRP